MTEETTVRADRYGEEQSMVRNEDGEYIGEDGYKYVRKDELERLTLKFFAVGVFVGVGLTAFIWIMFTNGASL